MAVPIVSMFWHRGKYYVIIQKPVCDRVNIMYQGRTGPCFKTGGFQLVSFKIGSRWVFFLKLKYVKLRLYNYNRCTHFTRQTKRINENTVKKKKKLYDIGRNNLRVNNEYVLSILQNKSIRKRLYA